MKNIIILFFSIVFLLLYILSSDNTDNNENVIKIYSNTNSTENIIWLVNNAKKAGFDIKIDDQTILRGDAAVVQAANENRDGDIIFGLNETRWSHIVNGSYPNLSLLDWKPTWANKVGNYLYDNKAYGLVVQNILMLYRTDELGTNGKKLSFEHWADIINCGYKWYRQGKVGGTTNSNINNAMLFPFADPNSKAGGIAVEGWKTLWKYCYNGIYTKDSYGFDPLNKGKVQVSTYYSSSLYGKIDNAAHNSDNPLRGTSKPINWNLVDIKDGSYYVAEYIGILDRKDRTKEQTENVKAFAEWFGSAQTQAEFAKEFDTYPCNIDAVDMVYDEKPQIYLLKNCAFEIVPNTNMKYSEYVAKHSKEWTNIMTNLGFYWSDTKKPPQEPDWDNLDWDLLCQSGN